jgi:hypothetical protein
MIEPFNPNQALKTLRDNIFKMEQLSEAVCNARNACLISEAELIDATAESLATRLSTMNATQAQLWNKVDIATFKKKLIDNEALLRNFQDAYNVVVESNQNLKMAIRMWQDEKNDTKWT